MKKKALTIKKAQVPFGHMAVANDAGIGLTIVHLVRRLSSNYSLAMVRVLNKHLGISILRGCTKASDKH